MALVPNSTYSIERVSISTERAVAPLSSGGSFFPFASSMVGRFVYIVGKCRVNHDDKAILSVLDIRLCKWKQTEIEGGSPMLRRSMVLYKDLLFTYHVHRLDFVSKYDMILEEWSSCQTSGESPGSSSFHSLDYVEKRNRCVLFCGRFASNSLHLLAMPGCRWVKPLVSGTPPRGRQGHGSCVHMGSVYYYGGWNGARSPDDGLYILTLGSRDRARWSRVQTNSAPFTALLGFAVVPFEGKLVLGGGMDAGNRQYAIERTRNAVTAYDLVTHEFEKIDLPVEMAANINIGAVGFTLPQGVGFLGRHDEPYHYYRVSIVE